jgi:hypothetical protein
MEIMKANLIDISSMINEQKDPATILQELIDVGMLTNANE